MLARKHETPEHVALKQEAAEMEARKLSLLERLAKKLDVPLDEAMAGIGGDLSGGGKK